MSRSPAFHKALISAVALAFLLAVGCDILTTSPTDTPTATPTPLEPRPTNSEPDTHAQPSLTATPSPTPAHMQTPQREIAIQITPQRPPSPGAQAPQPTSTLPAPTSTPLTILQLPNVAQVVEQTRPAVVSVVAEVLVCDFFGRVLRDSQSGSGVIFDSEGHVLTNNHVVQNATAVTVTMDDGRQFKVRVLGTDRLTDLAVLKIDGKDIPFVHLADPSSVRVGDWVIAIGNALALPGGPTVTVGVVSALDRVFPVRSDLQLYGLIQTDASINPGNSGGPLLNLRGEVVGINTAVARGDTQGRGVDGIGFASGMVTVAPVARQLIEKGRVQWAWLGVVLDDLDPQKAAELGVPIRDGALITNIVRDGPAWIGGIRAGDVVVSMAGENVATVTDLIGLIRRSEVGQRVEIKLFRETKEITLHVTLGEMPSQ